MALGAPTASEAARDVWYEVKDKDGKAQSFTCSTSVPPLTAKDFERLDDGKALGALLPFDLCYGLRKDQWYDIKVHLKYAPQDPAGLPSGALLNEMVTAPIRFQYRGPDPMDVYMEKLVKPTGRDGE
jgi:hypothetical protein